MPDGRAERSGKLPRVPQPESGGPKWAHLQMTCKQASNGERSGWRRSGGAGGRKAHLVVSVGRVVLEQCDALAVQAPIVPLPLLGEVLQKVRWSVLGAVGAPALPGAKPRPQV